MYLYMKKHSRKISCYSPFCNCFGQADFSDLTVQKNYAFVIKNTPFPLNTKKVNTPLL